MFCFGLPWKYVLSGPPPPVLLNIPGVPTKQELTGVLKTVDEIFIEFKDMIKVEGKSTNQAVVEDVARMVHRGEEMLQMMEENALLSNLLSLHFVLIMF